MPKIKPDNIMEIIDSNDMFDELLKKKKKKKRKDNGKKKKKKKKNNEKKKRKDNGKKKKKKKSYNGYIKNTLDTSNEIYQYRYNKNIFNKFLDKFNVDVDVQIKDETITSLIGIGAALVTKLITKK